MPVRKAYGARHDRPDARDFKFSDIPVSLDNGLPPFTMNRKYVWNIKDQGDEGSCTGHRTAEQWEWERFRFIGDRTKLSPQFVYDIERQLEGVPLTNDSGADPRDGCKCVTQYGICPEELMPYGPAIFSTPPTAQQLSEALRFKGGAYHRIQSLTDLKYCMASLPGFPGHVCSFAFDVPDYFESNEVASTGMVPVPPDPGNIAIVGGHDVLAVDYDTTVWCPGAHAPGAVLCQNSWGPDWGTDGGTGLRGFFWFPFEAIDLLVSDMWILHLGAPWRPAH